jgi:membrane associated rhomboid family serine protease
MPFDSGRRMPPATLSIICATAGVYILQIVPGIGGFLFAWGALVPARVFNSGEAWRLVSYLVLHDPANVLHLGFNMLALWMFGMELEDRWGSKTFAVWYVIGGAGAGLFSVFWWQVPIIGASGAVMALLAAYAVYFPRRTILFFFVLPMPVWVAVAVTGVISFAGSFSAAGGIAHVTHLGGILVGLLLVKGHSWSVGFAERVRTRAGESARYAAEQNEREKERFTHEVLDPILEKISKSGMASLSAREKKILEDAACRYRGIFNNSKITPFRK